MKRSFAAKNTEKILSGNLTDAILSLAIPLVANSFIQTMYNLTDTYWLGKLGTNELASISLITPLQNIIINFGMGLTTAGSILLAGYIGARDKKGASDMANQLFVFALLLSLVCGALGIIFAPNIVDWLKADGEVRNGAITYIRVVLCDLPFLMSINTFAAISQSQGNTVAPMKLNMLGVLLNIVLDPLLMIVLKMGILGAALATAAAKIPCAAIAVYIMRYKKEDIGINLKNFRFDKRKIERILKIGLPTAIGGSTMQFGFLLMTKNVYVYGPSAMAAYGIGNKLNAIITLPSSAMGNACTTIVSQNIGAKQVDRAEKAYKRARIMCVIFLAAAGFIFSRHFVAEAVVRVFSKDENVIPMAIDFLSIMAFWCFTNGVYDTTKAIFNGSANTVVTMAVDVVRLWGFRFATLFVCSRFLGMQEKSVWYSVVVSNALSAAILYILYKFNVWKRKIKRDLL